MKKTTTRLVVLLTAGLLLTGCATPGATAPTTDAPPDPSATATEPSAEPTTPSDDVTAGGIPPVQLGMPFAEALAAIGAEPDANCPQMGFTNRDGYTMWTLRDAAADDSGPVVLVSASVPADAITSIGPRTPEGIGIGTTLAEARAAYPEAEEVEGGPERMYLKVRADEQGAVFLGYRPGDEVVWEITATALAVPPYEPCA